MDLCHSQIWAPLTLAPPWAPREDGLDASLSLPVSAGFWTNRQTGVSAPPYLQTSAAASQSYSGAYIKGKPGSTVNQRRQPRY